MAAIRRRLQTLTFGNFGSNGSCAGGDTLVGMVTTDGITPWTFNANDFAQV